MEMELNLKGLRIRIDAYSKLAKENLNQTSQVGKCIDQLLLGKAWIGKALGSIGVGTPYRKNGQRHSVEDIEKTAEEANMLIMNDIYNDAAFEGKNGVERIDWLREAIKDTIKTTVTTLTYGRYGEMIGETTINNVITHLSEARFWLGFELERQKTEA